MKRKTLLSSKLYIPIFAVFLIVTSLLAQPNVAAAAQVTSSCTDEITLVFSGLEPSQSIDISVSYSTGQSTTVSDASDGSGDLTVTLDRTSNEPFSVTAQVEYSESTISTTANCPSLDAESESSPTAGSAFVCEPAFYQVLGSKLNRLDPQTFEYNVLGQHTRGYNGIGYNVEDNFLYGIEKKNNDFHLVRINNQGMLTDLGAVEIGKKSNFRGDFDLDGNLVVTNGSTLDLIDVSATPPTVVSKNLTQVNDPSLNFHDITYNRVTNTFWTYTKGQIIEIDPVALTITNVGDYSDVVTGSPFGAAFSDVNGDMYFSKNNTGVIYFADLDSSGDIVNFYPIADGGSSSNNDGASCPNAAPPFEMSCGDGKDNDLDGLIDSADPDCTDTDGDGIVDLRDEDDDNDGIPDIVEQETAVNGGDTDNDGTPDSRDLDSDGDGDLDAVEAGHGATDTDLDGEIDGPFGENGLADSVETEVDSSSINYTITNSDPNTPPNFQVMTDTDGDGIPNIADLDDDNDGIPDAHECTYSVSNLPIAVVNGSFEDPDIDFSRDLFAQQWGRFPNVAVTIQDSNVNGWSTTAPDGRIEMWQDGFNRVDAFNGSQFAEINANGTGALYQDVATTPGTTMVWSFAHRGRYGADTIELNIGPSNGALTTVRTLTTDRNGWVVYTGEYEVPSGQTETRYEYQAVSTASNNTTIGNFLDNIQFSVKTDTLNCDLDTDEDGTIDSLDLDSDNDGLSDAYEAGHNLVDFDPEGRLKGEVGSNGLVDAVETEADSDILDYSIRDTNENGTPNFQEFDDHDGDGVEKEDLDFDNDGIPNIIECASGMPCIDDQDGDGIPNAFDLDSDNDGVNDLYEIRTPSTFATEWLNWLDPDQNGVLDGAVGNNGYNNAIETDDSQTASYNPAIGATPMDDDDDGLLNFLDVDSDGDGTFDIVEAGFGGLDPNNDGKIDEITDHDFDGIPTVADGDPAEFGDSVPTGLTVELFTDRSTIQMGNTVEVTMLIRNVGGAKAANLDIEAELPANLTADTSSWNVAEIAAGSTHTITWTSTVGSTEANQNYQISVRAIGEDADGNTIPSDNSLLVGADTDPDDRASASLMGLGDTVCETQVKNVAFEDLKNDPLLADWDYNDLIVKLEAEICFTPTGTPRVAAGGDIWFNSIAVADSANSCSDIEVEAESGTLYGFETVADAQASGGNYVHMQDLGVGDYVEVSSSRMITYSVNIPTTGTYELFGDVQGLHGRSDSFWIQIDDGSPILWNIPKNRSEFKQDYVTDFVNGRDNLSLELAAGDHIVTLYNREDGSRLDKLTFDCMEAAPTPDSALASTTITYTVLARGAGYEHQLYHNLPFLEGGQFNLTNYDGDGNEISSRNGLFDPANPVEIFASTQAALPPFSPYSQTNTRPEQTEMVNGHSAVLTFSVNNPENYIQGAVTGFPWDLYLPVLPPNGAPSQEVHLKIPGHMNNVQLVTEDKSPGSPMVGHSLPFGFVFEEEWTWPLEFEGIWKAYPDFVTFMDTGYNQKKDWFTPGNSFAPFLWNRRDTRFPVLPQDSEDVTTRYFASPVIADIDEDGKPEIIIGDLIGSKVSVFDLDQNLVWQKATDGGVRAEVTVEDIDFDGDVEIMVGDESGQLYAWHHDGTAVANFPFTVSSSRLLSSPAIEDINEDGQLEILQMSSDGNMYAFDLDGNKVWAAALTTTADTFGTQTRNGKPVIEDLDGDGQVEIIVPSASGAIFVFDGDGTMLWTYGAGDSITGTPVVANFDPDHPGYEIIFGSGDTFIYVLDQNGELIWKRPTGWIISSSPLLHDLDGDGFPEILIGGEDKKVHAFHYWAETVSGWPQEISGAITSAPVAGDIDADGEDEILIGGEDGKLYAWNSDGSDVPSWPKQTGVSYKGAPVIMNADSDAEEEIFAADFSGTLLTWGLTEDDPIIGPVSDAIYLPFMRR